MRRRLPELSWLEGSVPAGSPEEELEEAPGKAHEWGRLPAQHGAGARRPYRHGTNRSQSRVLPGALPHEDVVLFHCTGLGHLVWERQRGAFPAQRGIPCPEVPLEAEQE